MFDRVVFPHDLVQRVAVESSHEEHDHAWALPPGIFLATAFGEQQSCRETNSHRLSCPRSLEADHFSDTVS